MTYSLLARDPDTGELGVAVQSHFFGVGRVVPWAAAGVGVIATQSFVDVRYGIAGLEAIAEGVPPQAVLDRLVADDPGSDVRQVAMMGVDGRPVVFTGAACIPDAAHAVDAHACAQSNLCASPRIPEAMLAAFAAAEGDLTVRMIAALDAAEAEGGDIRGRQSAALMVVAGTRGADAAAGRLVDLRVDDHAEPLQELRRIAGVGEAMRGLLRILETEGLVRGERRAGDEVVAEADAELRAAQSALGPGNVEPTVWRGLILARAGRIDDARSAFASIAASRDAVAGFVARLASAGIGPEDPEVLRELVGPDPRAHP